MSFQLRPYQNAVIAEARHDMAQGKKSILIQSPTGSGKTVLIAFMLKSASSKGMASWFLVHRRELVKQSIETFRSVGIDFGIVSSGFAEDARHNLQIGSVQTVARRVDRLKKPTLIVWDEAHHLAADSWKSIYRKYPDSFHIGLTATPERLDGKGLSDFFSSMVEGPTVRWLIENKFLTPYRLFAPSNVSTTGIHTRMGDYVRSELETAMDKPSITGNAINEYRKLADGKRAVVFCVSIEHSKNVVGQFQADGIPAAHVDGETDVNERDEAIEKFRSGEIRVLSNVELFGEGFDLPAIEVAILLRPTLSLALYLQQIGRALRPSEGKNQAIILDHVGNCMRHGLPDEVRSWTLSGRDPIAAKNGEDGERVRICSRCFAAQFTGSVSCQFCGFVFPAKPRKVQQIDGDLVEIGESIARIKPRQEQGMARSFQDLVALGTARGYKRPYLWAKFVFNARQAKKLAKA